MDEDPPVDSATAATAASSCAALGGNFGIVMFPKQPALGGLVSTAESGNCNPVEALADLTAGSVVDFSPEKIALYQRVQQALDLLGQAGTGDSTRINPMRVFAIARTLPSDAPPQSIVDAYRKA